MTFIPHTHHANHGKNIMDQSDTQRKKFPIFSEKKEIIEYFFRPSFMQESLLMLAQHLASKFIRNSSISLLQKVYWIFPAKRKPAKHFATQMPQNNFEVIPEIDIETIRNWHSNTSIAAITYQVSENEFTQRKWRAELKKLHYIKYRNEQ